MFALCASLRNPDLLLDLQSYACVSATAVMWLLRPCLATGSSLLEYRSLVGGGEEAFRLRRRCRFRLLGSLSRMRVAVEAFDCGCLAQVLIAGWSCEGRFRESRRLAVLYQRARRDGVGWVWVILVKVGGSSCWRAGNRVGGDGTGRGRRRSLPSYCFVAVRHSHVVVVVS